MTNHLHYLEIEVTDHCNLKCAHCTHHSPYMLPGHYPLNELRRDLDLLARASVHFDLLRLMGGEPLLNPQIVDYVTACRQSGCFSRIGLCTNGTLLDRTDPALFRLLDFLHVLLYPTPMQSKVEREVQRLSTTFPALTVKSWNPGKFWTQDIRSCIKDERIVTRIWDECGMRDCNAIYRGWFVLCVQTYRKPLFLNQLGIRDSALEDWTRDAVALDSPTLGEDIKRLRDRTNHLGACNWCLGQSGVKTEHHQRGPDENPIDFDISMLKWAGEI